MQGWGGEGDKQVTDAVRTTTESRRNTESERMTGDEILYNLQIIKDQVLTHYKECHASLLIITYYNFHSPLPTYCNKLHSAHDARK